ncbi:hypothetical protein Pcaca05_18660 [Pectobacterium carotovorum subsp. carotovorum]|nr:hypothetical protein Pcaca05_18660 [Pectobacterium carotovorum subsp. carotovorum]
MRRAAQICDVWVDKKERGMSRVVERLKKQKPPVGGGFRDCLYHNQNGLMIDPIRSQ